VERSWFGGSPNKDDSTADGSTDGKEGSSKSVTEYGGTRCHGSISLHHMENSFGFLFDKQLKKAARSMLVTAPCIPPCMQ